MKISQQADVCISRMNSFVQIPMEPTYQDFKASFWRLLWMVSDETVQELADSINGTENEILTRGGIIFGQSLSFELMPNFWKEKLITVLVGMTNMRLGKSRNPEFKPRFIVRRQQCPKSKSATLSVLSLPME